MSPLEILQTEAMSEITAFTPLCFQNLLTPDLERFAERTDGLDMRIVVEPYSITAAPNDGEVQFKMNGRLHVGSHGRCINVAIHGSRDNDSDQIGFRTIERLYN